ncbi:betaine-aldehyde dehydrogenase [Pseudonocardia thermophila]|jgi:NAD-dependent aldehyde dehydrogenases|uniref:Betaine-aldehyde dehydrogenase n=1 Tax=Pseudonocardia thermophila TaxID=1848 RepID=A0A1M6Q6X5_PSETH|nr:aldehyde dehydrogenase family protein [Pseudonocardia thermophila]SHK15890.1 betaine-aldehyde dehydrogenase [Pseudonocardia thermophila]
MPSVGPPQRPSLFVGGTWTSGSGGAVDVHNPFDGSVVATIDQAGPDDVIRAVAAARTAFDTGPWPTTPVAERAALLRRVAELLVRDKEEIARVETLDTGKTLKESRIDVDDVTAVFRYYADLADKEAGRIVDVGLAHVVSRVVPVPVGVCALITPWNYPLLQLSWKVAPCLAAGNTCVIKPSEVTPLTSIMLVHLLEEAGVPEGVVNLVLGDGPTVGAPLTEHDDVDMVSFTGGLATGQAIIRASATTVKRVAVELGGKNPNVVFADTPLDLAADWAITAAFLHSGQVCSAGARLIVEDALHDELVAEIARRAERIRLGNGLDPASECGPLVSAAQLAKIEDYVASALAEGARLVCGGRRPDDPALKDGFFYRPTVFADVTRDMRVVREETFGPILTVERFTTEDEAIALANDTHYGLAGAVWTADQARAHRVASALRHGTVWINDYHPYVPGAEWGGMGRSGNGRELGPTGLAEYQEHKHVWHNTAPEPAGWFEG